MERHKHSKKALRDFVIPVEPGKNTDLEVRVRGGYVINAMYFPEGSGQLGEFVISVEEEVGAYTERKRWKFVLLGEGSEVPANSDQEFEHLCTDSVGLDESGKNQMVHLYVVIS